MVILQLTVVEAEDLADTLAFLEGPDEGLTPSEKSVQRKLITALEDLETE